VGVDNKGNFADGLGSALFAGEQVVVHSGQRSQRIGGAGGFRAGLYQQVGANPGWDYQVAFWYQLDERGGGVCRLGIDPTGGADPMGPTVQWTAGNEHHTWSQLAARVTATGAAITIFLEAAAEPRGAAAWFDDVELIAYPCPLEECAAPPPPEEHVCVDWKDEKKPREVATEYAKAGFRFAAPGQKSLRIVLWGPPPGQGKLLLPRRGLQVILPFAADRVAAHIAPMGDLPIALEAFDAAGVPLGLVNTAANQDPVQMLEMKMNGKGIAALLFLGGNGESLLIDLCAYKPDLSRDLREN
jgi:hypothetical protein